MYSFIKINLIFLLPFFMCNTYDFNPNSINYLKSEGVNDNTIKLDKVAFLELNDVELNHVKKSPVWRNFTQEGSQIKAKSGFHIVTGKMKNGGKLSVILKNQKNDKNSIDFTPYFSIVSETPHFILYCSCGSNVSHSTGDGCFTYATAGSGLVCGGQCSGDNAGSTCSFTILNLVTGQTTAPM